MLVLGLDFETTWEDPVDVEVLRVTEIGVVLWDITEHKPIDLFNTLVWNESYKPSPPELVELTGITDTMLQTFGRDPESSFKVLNRFMEQAEYVIAHNGNKFDKPLYENEVKRHGLDVIDRLWIDTRTDIEYPRHIKARKLTHLAAEHGFANPFSHRAVFDVLTMLKVFQNYDFEKVVERAKLPTMKVIARVSYHDRQQAKDRGYYWDGEKKVWFKEVKQDLAEVEEKDAPFPVQIFEGETA